MSPMSDSQLLEQIDRTVELLKEQNKHIEMMLEKIKDYLEEDCTRGAALNTLAGDATPRKE